MQEGPFPARQGITVLSVDPPSVPLGFTVQGYEGGPVLVEGKWVMQRSDLWVGREIVAPTLLGRVEAVVVEQDGVLRWRSAGLVGNLRFDADARHCWTTEWAATRSWWRDPPPSAAGGVTPTP